jgi:hypothetical protein
MQVKVLDQSYRCWMIGQIDIVTRTGFAIAVNIFVLFNTMKSYKVALASDTGGSVAPRVHRDLNPAD